MKLLFLGDFFWDYDEFPSDFEKICEFVKNNGYSVILNLETTLGNVGTPIKKRGPNLRSSNLTIQALKKLNVVAVCMANNHMMDYGELALQETIKLLEEAEISHVGAGKNLDEAVHELVLFIGGESIVIQNYGWNIEETVYATQDSAGCAPLNRDDIIYRTKMLREKYQDMTIVNIFHWGFEYNLLPMPLDIQFAHDVINAGASLVIGHHPHVMQPKEVWKGKLIYYSLGNFYFSSRRSNYKKKFETAKEINMCDYGMAVGFDTCEKKIIDEYVIKYNVVTDMSYFDMKIGGYLIEDISNVEWQSEKYEKEVYLKKENINPVLGLDDKMNKYMVCKLFFSYWVAEKLQFVKKSKLGKKIFEQAKKILK